MYRDAMIPHGLALLAYSRGESGAELTIRRDDGLVQSVPVRAFFREPAEFSPIEVAALARCRGHVLDIGAGTGLHSLALQARGLTVTAIDLVPDAVEVMERRGVRDARCVDVFRFAGGPFDTLLMLGHGIGIVADVAGLDRFLAHARRLVRSGGQLLLHSLDVARATDPIHRTYHEANRRAGRYVGETRIRLEYERHAGPYCGWLHVDPDTLRAHAEPAGWRSEIVLEQDSGDYLARLVPSAVG
jgi:SAM-dependent methyltransferase